LENELRASELVDEFTVIALAALAGEYPHASALEFPDETANVTPLATAPFTALFRDELKPPPRLMLATDGPLAVAAT
jgi:hypothetical protein